MAATPNVVDELVVRLTLDAEQYQTAERKIDREIDRTERKTKERARTADLRDRDQQRRFKDMSAGIKGFVAQAAAAIGVVTGIGVAVGGALTGLLSFETGLRRQTVGTALSNREMQAWGATARRLGADANAGAEAIAALAKERQQFELTGQAPTVMALSRMGVRVDRNASIEDILAQAQQLYRSAPEGQRQQFENTLAAQGVSADLILMIKSEIDVRQAYARSFAQASEENRKALDALADSLESMKAQAISVAATLLSALQPAIERGAEKLGDFATKVAEFSRDVQDAGGGVEGFRAALEKHAPELAASLQVMGDITAVVVDQLQLFGTALKNLGSWIRYALNLSRAPWGEQRLGDDLAGRLRQGGTALADWWRNRVAQARANDPDAMRAIYGRNLETPERIAEARANDPAAMREIYARNLENQELPRNIENDPPARAGSRGRPTPQALMSQIITEYGLTVPEAAAVVANWQRESSLNPAAYNPEGGGTGARGLAQWRGARTQAFKARYGVMPDQATVQQQVEFAFTDPYERDLIMQSLRKGQSAAQLGESVSRLYEAHGNVQEDMRRGREATRLAEEYNRSAARGPAGGAGTTVNIQNMTVQTDQPSAFVGGLERLSGSQNYNTVIR